MPLNAQTLRSLVAEPPCRVEETFAQPWPLKWNTPSLPLAPPNAHTSFGPSTDNLVTSPGKDFTTAQFLPFQRAVNRHISHEEVDDCWPTAQAFAAPDAETDQIPSDCG